MAEKAGNVWSLPRFWVSICSYKKQPVKKFWGRILDLAWLKFTVAALVRIVSIHMLYSIKPKLNALKNTVFVTT